MALLVPFTNDELLIVDKLNLMIDKLNLVEVVIDTPVPLFQRRELDGFDWAGEDSQHRVWSYLIQHKQYNTHLHYSYDVEDSLPATDIKIYVGAGVEYDMPTTNGNTVGSINISGLGFGYKTFYVVRFKVDRNDAKKVMLNMLYEKNGA